ncbi:hypothetical protein [Nocardia terpenica]|uniref:hypothetical protein n=1 Tax=Nocardia terpenica TaxID=455432 RepID=UPI002FDFC55E
MRDVVAELPDLGRVQPGAVARFQAELMAEPFGSEVGLGVRMPIGWVAEVVADMDTQVCRVRVGGVDEIDQDAVTRQQALAVVEGQIGGQLRVLPEALDLVWGDMAVDGDVGADTDDGDRAAVGIRIATHIVGGTRVSAAAVGDLGDMPVLGHLLPIGLTQSASVDRLLHLR